MGFCFPSVLFLLLLLNNKSPPNSVAENNHSVCSWRVQVRKPLDRVGGPASRSSLGPGGQLGSWELRCSEAASLTRCWLVLVVGGDLGWVCGQQHPLWLSHRAAWASGRHSSLGVFGLWVQAWVRISQDGSSIAFYAQISTDLQNHFRRFL